MLTRVCACTAYLPISTTIGSSDLRILGKRCQVPSTRHLADPRRPGESGRRLRRREGWTSRRRDGYVARSRPAQARARGHGGQPLAGKILGQPREVAANRDLPVAGDSPGRPDLRAGGMCIGATVGKDRSAHPARGSAKLAPDAVRGGAAQRGRAPPRVAPRPPGST